MSAPSVFILLWNSMQATPSPRSTMEAPEFFLTTPFDFFATVTDQTPGGASTGCQFPVLATGGRFRGVGVKRFLACGQELFYICCDRSVFLFHAGYGGLDAGGVPEVEGAEFPVEAAAHGAVHF